MKSGLFLSTALLILLSLAIWFYGPSFYYLEYAPFQPVANRVIAIGALVVLWGINNYFLARANARRKPREKTVIDWTPSDPVEELLTLLRLSFRNTMRTVRDKWTGREGRGRSIYALPWYLVLGTSQSGKTTLISDSDLSFPLAHVLNEHSKSAVGKLPQYWVTNESLLFDLPGAWLDAEALSNAARSLPDAPPPGAPAGSEESRLWNAFLGLLTEYRPRRPINGVILTLDVVDLIRSAPELDFVQNRS